MKELNPCKICGSEKYRIIAYGPDITYRVSCCDCSYCTIEKNTRQEAIDIWNTTLPNWWVNRNKRKKKSQDNQI